MSRNRGVVYTKPGEVQVQDIADPMSTAETNCARWRRDSVPVGLREKGGEALVDYRGAAL